jgi:hypothetical protein
VLFLYGKLHLKLFKTKQTKMFLKEILEKQNKKVKNLKVKEAKNRSD